MMREERALCVDVGEVMCQGRRLTNHHLPDYHYVVVEIRVHSSNVEQFYREKERIPIIPLEDRIASIPGGRRPAP